MRWGTPAPAGAPATTVPTACRSAAAARTHTARPPPWAAPPRSLRASKRKRAGRKALRFWWGSGVWEGGTWASSEVRTLNADAILRPGERGAQRHQHEHEGEAPVALQLPLLPRVLPVACAHQLGFAPVSHRREKCMDVCVHALPESVSHGGVCAGTAAVACSFPAAARLRVRAAARRACRAPHAREPAIDWRSVSSGVGAVDSQVRACSALLIAQASMARGLRFSTSSFLFAVQCSAVLRKMTILHPTALTPSGRPVLQQGEYEVHMLDKVRRPAALGGTQSAASAAAAASRHRPSSYGRQRTAAQVDLEFVASGQGGLPGQLLPAYKVRAAAEAAGTRGADGLDGQPRVMGLPRRVHSPTPLITIAHHHRRTATSC